MSDDLYARLIATLDELRATYRLIDHTPEGKTELVSAMRGHEVKHAAKCIILMAKFGKKTKRYVLAVTPGDRRLSLAAIKSALGATYVAFADAQTAERFAGCPVGTVLPFAFNQELQLIADPSLLESEEIFFNAARLDRSLALKTKDYVDIANPRFERITEA